MISKKCSFCNTILKNTFVNFGKLPIANKYIKGKNPIFKKYNLKIKVCHKCFLVQSTNKISPTKIFKKYYYKSSYSSTWVIHCKLLAKEISADNKNLKKKLLEIGSNDGTLLKEMAKKKFKCIGIEPATNLIKKVKFNKKINIYNNFFNYQLAKKIISKEEELDYVIGTNVIAHIPNIRDLLRGLQIIFSDKTIGIFEFQYLLPMIQNGLYDTIYHEHFFYHSLTTLNKILQKFCLKIFDAKRIKIHSGSLRIYICKINNQKKRSKRFLRLIKSENNYKLNNINTYKIFKKKFFLHKNRLSKLIKIQLKKKLICGYGAAAKGNTLLNVIKIKNKQIKFIFDKSNLKNKFIFPGTDIPIININKIKYIKPEYILILPWNIKNEIIKNLNYVKKWNGKFIIPFPKIQII